MKNNWPTKKIEDTCEIEYGTRIVKSRNEAGEFFVYGGGGKTFTTKDFNREDRIIISRFGMSPNCVRKVIGKFFLNDSGLTLSPKSSEELYKNYLELFLFSSEKEIYNLGRGQAQKNLDMDGFRGMKIPVPPINIQKQIVARLENLLGKIKEAKRLRVEAQEATDKLLSAELYKIFEEGKNKGWEEKELGEVCEINPKKSEVKDLKNDTLVSFVPMSSVDEDLQKITDFQERKIGEVKKGYTYFAEGDILFAKITPCMENGKVAIAKNLKNGIGFGTTEFHVLRPQKNLLAEWVYYILRQPSFRKIAEQKMTGSAGQKRVPVGFLEGYKILVPSLKEQKGIVARLDALSEKIKQLQEYQKQTLIDLDRLEKSILHKAFEN